MDLFQRFALGELDAFETLVREFQGDVYGWIVRIVRDPSAAEELTMETFWRIYRARARFDPDGNFAAWSRRIATNLALDHLKRRSSQQTREQALLNEPAATPPADHVLQREMHEAIQHAFRGLPAKLQVATTLALIEEQPYDAIADALGTSVGAVKLRVFRAVRILRQRLRHFRSGDLVAKT